MDRGSKFLAYAFPVASETDAADFLLQVKKEHPKARHFCTALRLLPDASFERVSDDGEPSGSAGRPILGQLTRLRLTNVFVIVVRYFGGTKLGVPGLIEAYKTSAAAALEESNIVRRQVYAMMALTLSYEAFPHFLNFCKQSGIPVWKEVFDERAEIVIGFKASLAEQELLSALHLYSHMNFDSIDQYANHLDFTIQRLPEEKIL